MDNWKRILLKTIRRRWMKRYQYCLLLLPLTSKNELLALSMDENSLNNNRLRVSYLMLRNDGSIRTRIRWTCHNYQNFSIWAKKVRYCRQTSFPAGHEIGERFYQNEMFSMYCIQATGHRGNSLSYRHQHLSYINSSGSNWLDILVKEKCMLVFTRSVTGNTRKLTFTRRRRAALNAPRENKLIID